MRASRLELFTRCKTGPHVFLCPITKSQVVLVIVSTIMPDRDAGYNAGRGDRGRSVRRPSAGGDRRNITSTARTWLWPTRRDPAWGSSAASSLASVHRLPLVFGRADPIGAPVGISTIVWRLRTCWRLVSSMQWPNHVASAGRADWARIKAGRR